MIQQYSATVDKFGKAYAVIRPSEKGAKAIIEYYLVFDDGGKAYINGGVLEVEKVLDQTLETYVKEHVAESLPYMVIRALVDHHKPEELEGIAAVVFNEDPDAIATIKSCYPDEAKRIADNAVSEDVKTAFSH